MNDIDIQQAEYETEARAIRQAEARGACFHDFMAGKCSRCGRVFKDEQEWLDALDEFKAEYL